MDENLWKVDTLKDKTLKNSQDFAQKPQRNCTFMNSASVVRQSHSYSNIILYLSHTSKNQNLKFETNIPRKGIARPQSQFPHSCVCERFIYSHDRSAYSAAGNMLTDPGNI
jgi:hypothetical protein